MKKPVRLPQAAVKKGWKVKLAHLWSGVFCALILPALGLYALTLAADFIPLVGLRAWPDFVFLSVLKTNFACSAPLFFLLAWRACKALFFAQTAFRAEQTVYSWVAGTTLAMLIVANVVLFTLYFTVFSTPRYVRCWEPFPLGWHFAVTPEVCVKHGYAPVRMLRADQPSQ